MKKFIITSNIFLFIPVIASAIVHEWLYFFFALGISIFSPIFHYLRENNSKRTKLLHAIRDFDWFFAVGAYIYMYYFIFTKVNNQFQVPLTIALSLTGIFFWYGFKFGNYKKFHPWFHIVAPVVSGLIVVSK
jgi:hypothetical protein